MPFLFDQAAVAKAKGKKKKNTHTKEGLSMMCFAQWSRLFQTLQEKKIETNPNIAARPQR
jgi:hypothetical protein